MVYSKELLFIHIPKCAGTSVEKCLGLHNKKRFGYGVLRGKALQHRTYREYQEDMGNKIKKLESFTIVRNPYDRCISEYYWNPIVGVKSGITFNQFLNKIGQIVKNFNYKKRIKHFNDHHMRQYEFILGTNGTPSVDKIFYYENLDALKEYIEKYSVIPFPHSNISKKRQLTVENLTLYQKKKIEEIYLKDFEYFNYSILSHNNKNEIVTNQNKELVIRNEAKEPIKKGLKSSTPYLRRQRLLNQEIRRLNIRKTKNYSSIPNV
ncbi:MAG: hypothetical protein CBB97_21875 [Candidatus Endolissoclinum sp. TMED37]|nr:MAG: hypothetical protein CBB97_21875 [Candidatus Endolissoclinum sp. TMED37]